MSSLRTQTVTTAFTLHSALQQQAPALFAQLLAT
jgi:hypothetical protein